MNYSFYESNCGLGHGELNYYVKIGKNLFLCVGHQLYDNEPCIEVGTILEATNDYTKESTDDIEYIVRSYLTPCNNANVAINSKLIDYIIKQQRTIEKLTEHNTKIKE